MIIKVESIYLYHRYRLDIDSMKSDEEREKKIEGQIMWQAYQTDTFTIHMPSPSQPLQAFADFICACCYQKRHVLQQMINVGEAEKEVTSGTYGLMFYVGILQ